MKKYIISLILMITLLAAGCNMTIRVVTDDFELQKDDDTLELMAGATAASHAFCIDDHPDYAFSDIDDAYLLLVDSETFDMYDADASTPTITTTYADAEIHLTKDAQTLHGACGTIPAADTTKKLWLLLLEDGVDTLIDSFCYDPTTGHTYSLTNPLYEKRVRIWDY
jgi:hypothetical protein